MTVRISRPKLMALAGIGARVTIDININHLSNVGLIEVRSIAGEHEGNEYTVYLPEETKQSDADTDISIPSQTSQTSVTRSTHKLDRLVRLETSQTRYTLNQDLPIGYGMPNTSFNTDDDTHTIDEFAHLILEGARQILGGKLPTTEQERQRWKDCACVLLDEMKEAAGKTKTISSVPAFFAAHLRRRFATRRKGKHHAVETNEPSVANKSKVGDNLEGTAQSQFTLEECRGYAEHLQKSGQGITNPGGYATTIYRTGEADSLIRAFIDQPAKPDLPDASNCANCKGTGFWYPRGIENGVVKCKHDRLPNGDTEAAEL